MAKVGIIYHSVTGTTEKIALAVQEGALAEGSSVSLIKIQPDDIVDGRYINEAALKELDTADAIIFGAPTFMGGPSAQFKMFADATSERWEPQAWQDKLAAGFTVGGSPNGDQTSTLNYFVVLAAQHGMVWLGVNIPGGSDSQHRNRLGVHLGVSAQTMASSVEESYLATARHLGARVALFAQRLATVLDPLPG
jgi:multimeric flavodoxin WrbA